jgi:hypothetical protein
MSALTHAVDFPSTENREHVDAFYTAPRNAAHRIFSNENGGRVDASAHINLSRALRG